MLKKNSNSNRLARYSSILLPTGTEHTNTGTNKGSKEGPNTNRGSNLQSSFLEKNCPQLAGNRVLEINAQRLCPSGRGAKAP